MKFVTGIGVKKKICTINLLFCILNICGYVVNAKCLLVMILHGMENTPGCAQYIYWLACCYFAKQLHVGELRGASSRSVFVTCSIIDCSRV